MNDNYPEQVQQLAEVFNMPFAPFRELLQHAEDLQRIYEERQSEPSTQQQLFHA